MGSLDHPSNQPTSPITLPIISLSPTSFTPSNARATLAAAHKYGFLYIDPSTTPFTPSHITNQFSISERFFSSPLSEKQKHQITIANKGWTGMHNEILDPASQKRGDWKEAFNIGEFLKAGSKGDDSEGSWQEQQDLPDWMISKRRELFEFECLCRQTCNDVLDLLGMGLEIEGADGKQFFSKRHTKPSGSTVRLLHYPAVDGSEKLEGTDIRAGAHSDYGSCTLLFQRLGQPGLEIRTPEGGWASVAVMPDGYKPANPEFEGVPPILMNIGDLLSYWTNGMLKSTVHRVIFPKGEKRDRYSIAYFCHPGNEERLVAVPSKVVEGYRLEEGEEVGYGGGATGSGVAMTAREHLDHRLKATYDFRKDVEAK